MEPRVAVAEIPHGSADGTLTIGREGFPEFDRFARLGVHVQSDRVERLIRTQRTSRRRCWR